jgi:hypothetical protein
MRAIRPEFTLYSYILHQCYRQLRGSFAFTDIYIFMIFYQFSFLKRRRDGREKFDAALVSYDWSALYPICVSDNTDFEEGALHHCTREFCSS